MKKLITLTFALFVTAGIAFGQEPGQVNNEASIEQIDTQNTGDIEQRGINSVARIGQGIANRSDFNVNPGSSEFNEASILQTGNINDAEILQGVTDNANATRNQANILQSGNRNFALLNQGVFTGSAIGNQADIFQPGNDNSASINQGFGRILRNSSAEIIQSSDNNVAEIIQAGSNHSASITQN